MTKGPVNKFWSQEQVDLITKLYPRMTNANIAKIIGKHEKAIQGKAFKLQLKKDIDFMRECSRKGQFKKGDTPPNKGRKMTEWMSPEAIERTKATRFNKGNEPHNTKYDGAERICKDGYIEMRISKANWVHKHRHEWEKVYGPIPEGLILVCRTENKLNSHPDNWELITRVENMNRNSGPLNLSDTMVATYLATSSKKVDYGLKTELLENHPELIKTKRTHLKLNRKIKEHGTQQNN